MQTLVIEGKNKLNGNVKLQGAKNAVLPIMAGCLLCDDKITLENCPSLTDVFVAAEILKHLGCDAVIKENVIEICSKNSEKYDIPDFLMTRMRSSVMFLGAIISRFHKAVISYPGGCDLGKRPIDLHLSALEKLGVKIKEDGNKIYCSCEKIIPCKINLDIPSVGATENIMLASCISKGRTVINNPAKEPEIVDLQNFLNKMGGQIKGAGTNKIIIDGVEKLTGGRYSVMPDRIVASTILFATAIAGGDVCINGVQNKDLRHITRLLSFCGCSVEEKEKCVRIISKNKLKAIPYTKTGAYPGFPTDAQPFLVSCMATAEGKSIIKENIFSDRFRFTNELRKMGGEIFVKNNKAYVRGVETLYGRNVSAEELRGGAALVIASLGARGKTVIDNIEFIDRGYESIEKVFSSLGGNIRREINEETS